MKNRIILTLAVFLPSLQSVPHAGAAEKLQPARNALLSSSPQRAAALYAPQAAVSIDALRIAEYAYALAVAGFAESALYNIDRALVLDPLNSEVRFYLSGVLSAFGLDDAGAEQRCAAPRWLKKPPAPPALDISLPEGGAEKRFSYINLLMVQRRYAQSAVLLDRLCRAMPDSARCWSGYGIALEKLGAYKSAAAALAEDVKLTKSEEHRKDAETLRAELLKRQPPQYGSAASKALKGRYLAYLGGNFNRNEFMTTYSLSGRAGKFLSNRVDLALNGGFSMGNSYGDYNGLTLGLSGRYNVPLPLALPLNGTLAVKLERVPSPEKTSTLILSPGISYFMSAGSVDVFWDLALSGAYKGSSTFSAGYTVYFGGGASR